MSRESDFDREERQRSELSAIVKKQTDLEAQLGLTKAMERARDFNFIPLGIDGENVSSDEYFADEHDGERRRVRKVYFGVPDVERRKELIELRRQLDQKIERQCEEDLWRAEAAVTQARRASRQLPWEWAAIIAVGCVVLGYYSHGLVGAIAGAVGGVFLAQGVVTKRKAQLLDELETAEGALADQEKARRIASLSPKQFSVIEEITGEEDREFGKQSAWLNVVEYERQQELKDAEAQ